jgi:leader peptidase (prepilin peptidase)/N-methyltransferase
MMTAFHHAAVTGFGFAVGAAVGSFLNVCVWRLPRGESLIRPASHCPRCESPISARDNLPVVGWLALGGRCRHCKAPISPRYPLVEAAVGLLFALVILIESTVGPFDPFERGLSVVLARLVYHWALVALLVTAALIGYDRRSSSARLHVSSFLAMPSAIRATAAIGLDGKSLAAVFVALFACLAGDPIGACLNLALLAVFLHGLRSS